MTVYKLEISWYDSLDGEYNNDLIGVFTTTEEAAKAGNTWLKEFNAPCHFDIYEKYGHCEFKPRDEEEWGYSPVVSIDISPMELDKMLLEPDPRWF